MLLQLDVILAAAQLDLIMPTDRETVVMVEVQGLHLVLEQVLLVELQQYYLQVVLEQRVYLW